MAEAKQKLTDTKVMAIKPPADGQAEYPDELVVGLRLRIGASGKKTWILRSRVADKSVNVKLGSYPQISLSQARQLARERMHHLAEAELPREERTVTDVVDEFITRYAKPRNRTWRDVQTQFNKHVLPYWGKRDITTIRKRDIIEVLDRVVDGGAAINANRVHSTISKLFRWSLSRDIIETNPISGVAKPSKENVRDRVLADSEIVALWASADAMGYPFGIMLKLLLLTGQRLGEVSGMKWPDVDLQSGTWILNRDDTKANRKHLVALSDFTVSILHGLPRLADPESKDGLEPSKYVLTTNGRSSISGWSKPKERVDLLMSVQLGIERSSLPGWVYHDLRRTAATNMTKRGVSRFIVSRILNHAEQGVTGLHYDFYEYAEEKRTAVNLWASAIKQMCKIS